MASFATISKCGASVAGARATPARPQQQLRRAVVVKAHQETDTREVSRRGALGAVSVAVLSAASLTVSTSPAEAFLGIGGPSAEEKYVADTGNMITITNKLLALARDDPAKADAVAEVRSSTNVWVAKYRRDDRFAGKPSYSNMYSVLNAISGHYNSFGPEAPIPKKRLERINKELVDAEKLLARNR